MIAKRVTVGVAVIVTVLFGLCVFAGMATAASDRIGIDSPTSEHGSVGSSIGESPQQIQSTTETIQQSTDRVFASYNELRGSSIEQGQTVTVDVGQAGVSVQLRQRIGSDDSRLRGQYVANDNGEIEIDSSDLTSGDYFITGNDNTAEYPYTIEDTFIIYQVGTTSTAAPDRNFISYEEVTGSTIWQGQKFSAELPIPNAEVQLRQQINQTTRLRGIFTTDRDGTVAVDIRQHSGGEYYLTGAGVNSGNIQQDGTFQIERQSLEVDFQRDQVIGNQRASTDISFSSNRFAYPVTVSATNNRGDDLSTQQLTNVFEEAGQFVVTERDSQASSPDTVTIQTADEEGVVDFDQYSVDLSGITEGRYTFTFDVADTTATTTSDIVVGEIDPTQTDGKVEFNSYDQLTGAVVWTGQTAVIDGLEPNTDIQLRKRIDDDSSRLVGEFRSDSSGTITIETGSYLSGNYYLQDGGAYDNFGVPDIGETFELVTQTLTADIKSNSVGNTVGSTTLLEIDSNRGRYPITVHANGELSSEELRDIFADNRRSSFDYVDTRRGNNGISKFDEIRIQGVTDSDEFRLDFTGIQSGEYELVFSATDSVVADTAGVTVRESAGDQVEISSPEIDPSIVTNSSDSHTLTFEALNVSADGGQDDFTVEMPQSVEIVDVTDVAVVNGDYDVTYSNNENMIEFTADPERNVDSVDLVFEVDMTLIGSDTVANG